MKTQETTNAAVALFLAFDPSATLEAYDGLWIVRSTHESKPTARIWRGNSKRSFAYIAFRDVESRETFITTEMKKQDAIRAAQTARKETRGKEAAETANTVNVGDIFYISWGWEQTNVDFYLVVERKGSKVVFERIGKTISPSGGEHSMAGNAAPDPKARGGDFITTVIRSGQVKIEGRLASKHRPGQKHYVSWYA